MSYRDTALEVWDMELAQGGSVKGCMLSAVEAAVATALRGQTIGIRDDILEKAEDIDADENNDLNEDGPAALIFYAMLLDETLPPEYQKEEI